MPLSEILKRMDSGRTCLDLYQRAEIEDMISKRQIPFHIQSAALATDRLIILPYAAKKRIKEFLENPLFLAQHQRWLNEDGSFPVLGNIVDVSWNDEGMFAVAEFAETPIAEQAWELYQPRQDDKGKFGPGYMRAVSIGWRSGYRIETDSKKMLKILEKNGIKISPEEINQLHGVITELSLREVSAVMFGADPKALSAISHCAETGNDFAREFIRHAAENGDEKAQEIVEGFDSTPPQTPPEPEHGEDDSTRGTIPYKKYPLAPIGQTWDAGAQVKKADPDKLKRMSTWFDSEKPDAKGSYKLPHHMAEDFKTVWNGVKAAMGVVFGARGGLKGKALKDRKPIYNHLAKHYKDFDKTPPEFRDDYTEEELRGLEKAGVIIIPRMEPITIDITSLHDTIPNFESFRDALIKELNNGCGETVTLAFIDNSHEETQDETPEDSPGPEDGDQREESTSEIYGEVLEMTRDVVESGKKPGGDKPLPDDLVDLVNQPQNEKEN